MTTVPDGFVVDKEMPLGGTRPGGVSSTNVYSTVTVKLDVPVLPAASDAEHVTVVVPTGKTENGAGSHDKLETLKLSVALMPELVDAVPSEE